MIAYFSFYDTFDYIPYMYVSFISQLCSLGNGTETRLLKFKLLVVLFQHKWAEEICDILISYDRFSRFYTLLKSREIQQKSNAATMSRFWLHITSACVVYADPAD